MADLLDGRDLPVEGVGNPDAAAKADVVFLVFPYAGQADVLPDLAGPIGGKVVVDVINPLGWDDQGPYLEEVPEGSAAEQAAACCPRPGWWPPSTMPRPSCWPTPNGRSRPTCWSRATTRRPRAWCWSWPTRSPAAAGSTPGRCGWPASWRGSRR